MNNIPKPPPRFVPTLTEVVDPAGLSHLPHQSLPDVQALVRQVQHQMQPLIEQKLNTELEGMVHAVHVTLSQRWDELSSQLQAEINTRIEQAVADALKLRKSQK